MMADDKLLQELGKLAAEQRREGERSKWERLAKGELAASEVEDLEQGTSEEERALLAAARPLDQSSRDRTFEMLAAHVRPQATPITRLRSRIGAIAGALAVAAGIALFLARSGPGDLPVYALDSSGASTSRAAPATDSNGCRLHASQRGSFELVVRPNDRVEGSVAAQAFLVRGVDVEPWSGAFELSPQGAARILDENPKLAGASELRIVVSRPGAVDPLAKARDPDARGRGFQVFRCTISTD
jgi:hypothetical protein